MLLLGVGIFCRFQGLLSNLCNCIFPDATGLTVVRLHPLSEEFCSLARIARSAAPGNILTGNDACIVDDMLPGCNGYPRATLGHFLYHLNAAVDAGRVSRPDFAFEPGRDAPTVHRLSLSLMRSHN